jgi:predicted nucleotidyltransferase
MVPADAIIDYANAVAAKVSPTKVILFGSYAHGSASDDSDVDLLIVMDFRGRAEREAARIRTALSASFPLDLLVRRQSEIDRRIACNDFFLKDVMEKGLVLYAANDARMGEQGRRRLRRRHASAPVAQA